LHSINAADDRILFGAVGFRLAEQSASSANSERPHSEIFEAAFDCNASRIIASIPALKPKLYAEGYSVFPALSQDGRLVAFLNAEFGKGAYRFNLMIVDDNGFKKRIDLEGRNFSRPAFAGDKMLFNELFDDRYKVKVWSEADNLIGEVFQIEFSKLEELDRVKLLFASP
jgi:hypothetical protein